MNAKTGRLEWIDSLKGFAILLVVMGHVIPWSICNFDIISRTNPNSVLIWHIIYAFHMPLFMFVSGFLFGMSHYVRFNNLVQKLANKGKKLIIPYLVSGILVFMWRGGGEIFVYWYLLTLFQLLLIVGTTTYFVDKISKRSLRVLAELLFLLVIHLILNFFTKYYNGPLLYVCYDWFPHLRSMFFYFAAGSFIMRNLDISKLIDERIYSLCLFLFIFSFIYPNIPYRFVSINLRSIFAIYCCIYLFKECFNNGHIIERLKLYGKKTLHIYILHLFWGIQIYEVGEYVISMSNINRMGFVSSFVIEMVLSLIVSLFIIEMCLLLGKLIKTSRILSLTILGE